MSGPCDCGHFAGLAASDCVRLLPRYFLAGGNKPVSVEYVLVALALVVLSAAPLFPRARNRCECGDCKRERERNRG